MKVKIITINTMKWDLKIDMYKQEHLKWEQNISNKHWHFLQKSKLLRNKL